ncbi:bifunctional N(6)-L-threonylcarbamoyladenine synthase/serine/threonine protein kinase [Halapricum hydrolyticum]|uniref:Probable bifunctional tRNA threonylcarbamoyladenosine biosynthesis protein n=1 Tax=Halapricum hydrolyticum TaxID=2979991 RepID=A0AAE3LE49_9EURY|nr:bifunctional N(6)-L-threonylcarbamoyladenine synthase/serine/threonine protein kinase [Halapricum hydrolyticum]MCU4719658.1 bifunctional N(6)-L-threonylcarbamoyladenine synthase/serine/threonine protein kinase [Halapricum hydrolyticum]MCU4725956.1 bifunctional N(6)-L-threonylcarbamoyladenine synthase/serine/threonine protein kinase [Halapricum hydrolyticum]
MDRSRSLRVLGIEGTAWAASAAVFETSDPTRRTDDERVEIYTDAYEPDSGGIHPREAAEHMHEAIPEVVAQARETAREWAGEYDGRDRQPIDAVAFSRGPGLGPCLRIVATAARATAQRFDVPLVGVNHMVAHLEIGRHRSGFDSPVCLNASGANAHVLGYRNGRYRVLGETMDTGVGNAIDKFTRHLGWSHPGGPKVEERAKDGEFVDLPYVVKGMDFSFSGIMSAAKQAVDNGEAVEDVCFGLQEHVFAMLTEVSERALSLTGSGQLVLGGGVAQNDRLREMLESMCEQRGADFYAPEARFLRDNAGMIAVLGAKMFEADDTLPIEESRIDSNFRPDQVPVTWREDEDWTADGDSVRVGKDDRADGGGHAGDALQGAEATVTFEDGLVTKRRNPRTYRHETLDDRLRRERTRLEARLTSQARREGVPTPVIEDVDPENGVLVYQRVGEADLRDDLTEARVRDVGRHLATIHDAGFVHGDPTTRNVRVGREASETRSSKTTDNAATAERTYLIDFGLGYFTDDAEDYAMDLHVFDQSLTGTADDAEPLLAAAREAYRAESSDPETVLERLREIEGRGRYQ